MKQKSGNTLENNKKSITFAPKKINMAKYFFLLSAICFFSTCIPDSKIESELQLIKLLGDTDPLAAMEQLDSLSDTMSGSAKRTIMLRDLLGIRLRDKAYLQPDSESNILQIVDYFDQHGNVREKQEAYYYAGSNYRDWNDTPRSLEYYLKSVDIGLDNELECDSLLLRNAYSNIGSLLDQVRDYNQALSYIKKERDLSILLGRRTIKTDLRLGVAYANCDSVPQAIEAFDRVMTQISSSSTGSVDIKSAATALYYYSFYDYVERAEQCYSQIKGKEELMHCKNGPLALSEYHQMNGNVDSAALYLEHILQNAPEVSKRYNAAKCLFFIENWNKDYAKASQYANRFILLCDTLNFNERMEQVRTAQNQYQYYRDKDEEEKIKERSELYARGSIIVIAAAILMLMIVVFIFERKKNKHLREVLSLSNELEEIKKQKHSFAEQVQQQKKDLKIAQETLTMSVKELVATQERLLDVNSKLKKYEMELKEKDDLLNEKTEQTQTILQLLHRNNAECEAESIIQSFIKASEGRAKLTIDDWNQLYLVVDRLYPDFQDQLVKNFKSISVKQMQFCYLLQIGLTNGLIENILPLSRVTIWRWSKTFGPVILSGDMER